MADIQQFVLPPRTRSARVESNARPYWLSFLKMFRFNPVYLSVNILSISLQNILHHVFPSNTTVSVMISETKILNFTPFWEWMWPHCTSLHTRLLFDCIYWGCQYDVRVPTRWRLSLLLLWLPRWCMTAEFHGALGLACNWVGNIWRMSHRMRVPTRWWPLLYFCVYIFPLLENSARVSTLPNVQLHSGVMSILRGIKFVLLWNRGGARVNR